MTYIMSTYVISTYICNVTNIQYVYILVLQGDTRLQAAGLRGTGGGAGRAGWVGGGDWGGDTEVMALMDVGSFVGDVGGGGGGMGTSGWRRSMCFSCSRS
jgi:hypothetical protein